MATKKVAEDKKEEIIDTPEEIKPGIVKEWMQNGHRMRRVRDEYGTLTDIRL